MFKIKYTTIFIFFIFLNLTYSIDFGDLKYYKIDDIDLITFITEENNFISVSKNGIPLSDFPINFTDDENLYNTIKTDKNGIIVLPNIENNLSIKIKNNKIPIWQSKNIPNQMKIKFYLNNNSLTGYFINQTNLTKINYETYYNGEIIDRGTININQNIFTINLNKYSEGTIIKFFNNNKIISQFYLSTKKNIHIEAISKFDSGIFEYEEINNNHLIFYTNQNIEYLESSNNRNFIDQINNKYKLKINTKFLNISDKIKFYYQNGDIDYYNISIPYLSSNIMTTDFFSQYNKNKFYIFSDKQYNIAIIYYDSYVQKIFYTKTNIGLNIFNIPEEIKNRDYLKIRILNLNNPYNNVLIAIKGNLENQYLFNDYYFKNEFSLPFDNKNLENNIANVIINFYYPKYSNNDEIICEYHIENKGNSNENISIKQIIDNKETILSQVNLKPKESKKMKLKINIINNFIPSIFIETNQNLFYINSKRIEKIPNYTEYNNIFGVIYEDRTTDINIESGNYNKTKIFLSKSDVIFGINPINTDLTKDIFFYQSLLNFLINDYVNEYEDQTFLYKFFTGNGISYSIYSKTPDIDSTLLYLACAKIIKSLYNETIYKKSLSFINENIEKITNKNIYEYIIDNKNDLSTLINSSSRRLSFIFLLLNEIKKELNSNLSYSLEFKNYKYNNILLNKYINNHEFIIENINNEKNYKLKIGKKNKTPLYYNIFFPSNNYDKKNNIILDIKDEMKNSNIYEFKNFDESLYIINPENIHLIDELYLLNQLGLFKIDPKSVFYLTKNFSLYIKTTFDITDNYISLIKSNL